MAFDLFYFTIFYAFTNNNYFLNTVNAKSICTESLQKNLVLKNKY